MQRASAYRACFAATAVAFGLTGCFASKQPIPLDCVPHEVEVYVDGRLLEGRPDAISLTRDESHKIYLKRPGYAPELLVLEPQPDADGRNQLSAGDVCVDLVPIAVDRELTVEGENDVEE
jgi:hypothetical protein